MSSLIRALLPEFDPGPTVESAGVRPAKAPEVNVADLDEALQKQLHRAEGRAAETVGEETEAASSGQPD
jgi:hypothetical protein